MIAALTLKSALRRPADLVARYGGEEFACVLPETSFEDAMNLAGELERKVRERAIPHATSPVNNVVTVSLGVATREGNSDGDAPMLIGLADNQLYNAKHTGRGRVCGEIFAPKGDV
jgi:diguanylate cyclase (GGDEF)-like protein